MNATIASAVQERRPSSHYDVCAIVGTLDESIIAAIIHTGATLTEIQQAHSYLEEHLYTKSVVRKRMAHGIRSVYDILDYERSHFR